MKKNVLLVDDDSKDIELTVAALREKNLINEIDVAYDGKEALDYLYCRNKYKNRKDCVPALVILDIKMPKVDGIEVLETIKKDPKLKSVPIVMLTSSKQDSDLKKCYELGVNAYVQKPIDVGEFIDALQKVGAFWLIVNQTSVQS